MSGILGTVWTTAPEDASEAIGRMRSSVPFDLAQNHDTWVEQSGRAGFAAYSPAHQRVAGRHLEDSASGLVCVVDGTPLPLDPGMIGTRASHAERILAHYRDGSWHELAGSFNAAIWDPSPGRLTLVNDRTGYRRLYLARDRGALVFGSLVDPVLANRATAPGIDDEALACLLALRYLPGARTLLSGVQILPPGSVLTFEQGRESLRPYWRLDQIEVRGGYGPSRVGELCEAMLSAVRRGATGDGATGIALTGGLDSRCLLAAGSRLGSDMVAWTEGVEESTDLRLARQLAEQVGIEHRYLPTDPAGLTHHLGDMVRLQGATASALILHPCLFLSRQPPEDRVINGLIGETARPGAKWHGGRWTVDSAVELQESMARAPSGLGPDTGDAWHAAFSHLHDVPSRVVRDTAAGYDLSQGAERVWGFFQVEHSGRKELAGGTVLIDPVFDTRLPYLDPAWLDAVLSVPTDLRIEHPVQMDMLGALSPELLSIPFEKKKPVFARSAVKRFAQRQARRVARRMGRTGPPQPVPAFPYWSWTQAQFRGALRGLLTDKAAVWPRMLRPDRIQPMLDAHFEGSKDMGQLVHGLLVLEMTNRIWIEPAGVDQALSQWSVA